MWRQVRQVKMGLKETKEEEDEDEDADEPQPGITNEDGLPGLPWPKHENDWLFTNYRQCLFMYLDPSSDI